MLLKLNKLAPCDIIVIEIKQIKLFKKVEDMYLTQKLKSIEKQLVFMKWGNTADYGKIKYVGQDFIEFEVLDKETLEYNKAIIVNPNVVTEIVFQSPDINRVIAAISCNLPSSGEESLN